jgi:teichoic acid transport system ATP-binding protein
MTATTTPGATCTRGRKLVSSDGDVGGALTRAALRARAWRAAGMTRAEIDSQFDEIAEFSELGDAIDSPMRTYSSGMYARLAFSVAATVKPDILIIDEALSTGDARFKEKSLNRIKELRTEDRALILVSHALATIEDICNEVIWLDKGKLMSRGKPAEVIAAYREFMQVRKSASSDEDV